MDLPNYFLADLPDASTLSPKLISESCQSLKRNREQYLQPRTTDSMITALASLARDWLDPEYPFRKYVLAEGPARTGFSRETIAAGLDNFFGAITRPELEALLVQDLGSVRRLDEIVSDETELKQDRGSLARGHHLLVQITGGVLPNSTLLGIMLGLLVRSAQFVKCATGTSFIPRMFAHSLYQLQPKLGACLEVAEWRGGNEALEGALFAEADCVTATGTDETLAAIRKRLHTRTRFVGYGHKLSFALITREALVPLTLRKVAQAAARDVAAWDQLGCLSPHVIYVETGGAVSPHAFSEALAAELAAIESAQPRTSLDAETAAAIATRRMFHEVRAAHSDETKLWASPASTAWTVVYEEDPRFQTSCLNRFIYVKPAATPQQMLEALDHVAANLSTAGISAPPHRAQELANILARHGVSRVCRIGQMQNPPLTWRHDGRPALADLVAWTDLEI